MTRVPTTSYYPMDIPDQGPEPQVLIHFVRCSECGLRRVEACVKKIHAIGWGLVELDAGIMFTSMRTVHHHATVESVLEISVCGKNLIVKKSMHSHPPPGGG